MPEKTTASVKPAVLIIVHCLTDGGAERVVSELICVLSRTSRVFVALYEDRISYPFAGTKILLRAAKIRNPILRRLALVAEVRRLKRQLKPNQTISFLAEPNIVNLLAGGPGQTIVTVHTHLSSYYARKSYLQVLVNRLTIKILYRLAHRIVGVSEGIAKDLRKKFHLPAHQVAVAYNAYSLPRLRSLSRESVPEAYSNCFRKPVILNIGRLTYSKGQWNLIRAFRRVRHAVDSNLLILGDGRYRKRLEQLVIDGGLTDSVHLTGFQQNPYPFIRQAAVLVSASKFEGLSNVIVESLAIGTPVVATDCHTGPREILQEDFRSSKQTRTARYTDYGVLLPVRHPENSWPDGDLTHEEEEMADSLITMLTDRSLLEAYGRQGLNRSKYFSFAHRLTDWASILAP